MLQAGAGSSLTNLKPKQVKRIPKPLHARYFNGAKGQFYRFGVSDDGSCFYHTLSASLGVDDFHRHSKRAQQSIGRNLRRSIQERLFTNADDWNRFWTTQGVKSHPSHEEVVRKLKDPVQWADVYAIRYLMDRLDVNILFFDQWGDRVYCGVENFKVESPDPKRKHVLVMWVNHAHFEPLFRMKGDGSMQTIFTADDDIIKNLYRKYHAECKDVKLHDVA